MLAVAVRGSQRTDVSPDNGKVLIFEKRVRVNIDPASLNAAEAKSGETNASQ